MRGAGIAIILTGRGSTAAPTNRTEVVCCAEVVVVARVPLLGSTYRITDKMFRLQKQ